MPPRTVGIEKDAQLREEENRLTWRDLPGSKRERVSSPNGHRGRHKTYHDRGQDDRVLESQVRRRIGLRDTENGV